MEVWDIFGFTYSDRHSISLDTSVRAWLLFVENEEFVKRKIFKTLLGWTKR